MDPLVLVALVLVLFWLIGGIGFHIGGNFIHALLVIAVIVILVRWSQGRSV